MIVVNPGGIESWIGPRTVAILYEALSRLPYTILWKASLPHLKPNATTINYKPSDTLAHFIIKDSVPLTDVLSM